MGTLIETERQPKKRAGDRNPIAQLLADVEYEGRTFGHPIQNLAVIAMKAQDKDDLLLEFNVNKELAKYIAPQLKAVEMKHEIDSRQPITIIIPQEDKDTLFSAPEEPVASLDDHLSSLDEILDGEVEDVEDNDSEDDYDSYDDIRVEGVVIDSKVYEKAKSFKDAKGYSNVANLSVLREGKK